MAESRWDTLRSVLAPKFVSYGGLFIVFVGAYDSLSNQLGLPTLRKVFGMTNAALMPWRGWLLVLQGIFVYGLFEYVRRLAKPAISSPSESARPSSWHGEFEAFKTSVLTRVQTQSDRLDGKIDGVAHKHWEEISDLQKDIQKVQNRIGELFTKNHLLDERFHAELVAIYWALRSILGRERLKDISSDIAAMAEGLSNKIELGERLSEREWAQWEHDHIIWDAHVSAWCQVGAAYIPDLHSRVYQPNEDLYLGHWTIRDDQFPSALAVHKYKTFRIAFAAWREARDALITAVEVTAFAGKPIRGNDKNAEGQ